MAPLSCSISQNGRASCRSAGIPALSLHLTGKQTAKNEKLGGAIFRLSFLFSEIHWVREGGIALNPAISWTERGFRSLRKLVYFGVNQAACCLFPVCIFAALALTKIVHVPGLHRYDLLLAICLLVQLAMYLSGLETKDEMKVIALFHVIGLALELFKVRMGSWSYPEAAWTKVGGVPLYSGFMYASVASYICQAWRRFDLGIAHWPGMLAAASLAAAIYLNFFTHHYWYDVRWWLTLALLVVFRRTSVSFTVDGVRYRMPLLLSFLLIAFFIWIAENISTFLGAWKYPDQLHSWRWVHLGKLSSWFLLVIISIVIVAQLKLTKERLKEKSSVKEVRKGDGESAC